MELPLRCLYYLFLMSILKCNATTIHNNVEEELRVRVRRQDGYVYDKPSISFDLPSQATTESTQAPTVDRILEQQMFYAYPAPAGGDSIDKGSTADTTVGTTAASAAGGSASSGYNYQSSTSGGVGYKYGTPAVGSAGTQTNTASLVSSVASQNSISSSNSASITNSKSGSGYSYKSPSPSLTSVQGSTEVSTSAPRYLPPSTGDATDSLTGNVNIVTGSVSPGYQDIRPATIPNTGTQTGSTPLGTLSETYLPPLVSNAESGSKTSTSVSSSAQTNSVSNIASQTGSISGGTLTERYLPPIVNNFDSANRTPTSTSINTQTKSGGSISIPSTGYLPPKSSPSPTTSQTPSYSSQPAAPASGYIPPSNTGPQPGSVAKPAAGYLPPGFF